MNIEVSFENFHSSSLSRTASFLSAALMSPQRTNQYCPHIEKYCRYKNFWVALGRCIKKSLGVASSTGSDRFVSVTVVIGWFDEGR